MSWRICLLLNLIFIAGLTVYADIVNRNVDRTIDLSSQLVKTSFKINAEETSGKQINQYVFLPNDQHMAYISAKDGLKRDVKVRRENERYVIVFNQASPTQTIHIETVSTKIIIPHPEQINQNDKQLVKYIGTLYFISPYKTTQQRTTAKLSSSNIISHTQVKPFSASSNKISFGPYENIEGNNNSELVIHFENETPFLTVNSLVRTIEVSHWGNIAVKEDITLSHTGAKLKGSFSRYEFQKDTRSGQSSVKSYKSILPASATGVYYRDTNGNISTSNMNVLRDSVDLELRPRFPLFGGWKTQYTLGYNVPSYEYLFNSGNQFQIKMRSIDHIHDDMVIEEAVIKIVLPEGSTNIELVTPYPVKRQPNGLLYTYLDTVGRPVISFTMSNLVENHISDFNLKYKFSKTTMFMEPLLVVGFIFIIFVITIIFLRLDFSITSHSHKE